MAFKYAVTDQNDIYFITTTVVGWIDVFTRKELAEVIIESLRYCQSQKGLIIYAWCLMPSHLHMIVSTKENHNLSDIIRDFKNSLLKRLSKRLEKLMKAENGYWISSPLLPKSISKTKNINSGRMVSIPSLYIQMSLKTKN